MASTDQPTARDMFDRMGIFGAVLAGLVGFVVSVFCFLIPLLHFVLGPLGPLIGGAVGGHLAGSGLLRIGLVVAIMTAGMTGVAAAATGLLFGEEVSSGFSKALPYIVFTYTAVLSTIGCVVGALVMGGKSGPASS